MSDFNNLVENLQADCDEKNVRKQELIKFLETATEEEIKTYYNQINPNGAVIPDNEIGLENVDTDDMPNFSFSYTNYRMEFAQNYATCGAIAFLHRAANEYKVPAEVPTYEIEDFLADPTIADPSDHITDERLIKMYAENKENMKERVIIHNFLQYAYGFDPDKHVRSSYKSNKADPTRRRPNTTAARQAVDSKNCIRKERTNDREGTSADQDYKIDPNDPVEKGCFNTIPPVEYFTRFNRFNQEHHEQLLQVTNDLYGSTPDIDFGLCIYEKHKNRQESKEFNKIHEKDVVASITNIDQNRWAIMGPYRQNRQKVEFFNSNTEILKAMMDKRAEDEPVAADIMKKQIKNKKAKNVAEAGPDAPEFTKWVKANKPDIASMGGEHVTDSKDSDDEKGTCPDGQVEINVFNIQDGGKGMSVHKIYNPVEAPAGTPDPDAFPGTMGLSGTNPNKDSKKVSFDTDTKA